MTRGPPQTCNTVLEWHITCEAQRSVVGYMQPADGHFAYGLELRKCLNNGLSPLFKKWSRNKPDNYRPVSLVSDVRKLLETLFRDRMVEFLVKHKLINTSQQGFLKARSCNILCFLEKITKWVDEGSPVDVIYLDFQKAFDKVPHQRFLLKLKAHGIGNGVINWIEKWLTHRRQRVIVDGEISNWKSVLSGVAQGSVLGPILFLI